MKCLKRQAVSLLQIAKTKMLTDIEVCRKEYKRQKRLEEIVTNRVLNRPKIKKWQVVAIFTILPFLLWGSIFLGVIIKTQVVYKFLLAFSLFLLVIESYLRICLVAAVKCYQHYAKEETRKTCKCIPSCSEYAIMCLKTIYPLAIALLKICKRLYVTCNGEEYKVDFPTKRGSKKFERII